MSLDVTLINKEPIKVVRTNIYIRSNGQSRELTFDEIKEKYGDIEVKEYIEETYEVFDANITHNLTDMAKEINVYKAVWYPENIGISVARDLIDPLRNGIHLMKSNPDECKKYNPSNGWGNYELFLEFLENYLNACYKYQDAIVKVCR